MVGHARRKELGTDLRAIFAAPDRKQALTIAASVAEKWRQKGNEKVAEHLEEHIEECLSCLAFPRVTAGASAPRTGWRGSERGDKASQQGGKDLPQREILPAPGDSVGGGAERGVDHGEALPGNGGAQRTLPRRGARSRGGDRPRNDEVRMSLEETTETSGLDLSPRTSVNKRAYFGYEEGGRVGSLLMVPLREHQRERGFRLRRLPTLSNN